MELRELKKEVQALPALEGEVRKLRDSWVRPLQNGALSSIDPELRKNIHRRVGLLQPVLKELRKRQIIHEKLQQQARQLIELKLSSFRGDGEQCRAIMQHLLTDDFFSLRGTIREIRECGELISYVRREYHAVNTMVHKHLPLEEALALHDTAHTHSRALKKLSAISQKQKEAVRDIGREFLALRKSIEEKKGSGRG